MDGRVNGDGPPAGAYLASHYRDRRNRLETRRVYYEDGRVDAFDGREWWVVCTFTCIQVADAKAAIRTCGLTTAEDLGAEGVYDAASLTYAWRVDGNIGKVANRVYPAQAHPVFVELERRLDALESAAGAEWAAI